MLEDLEKTLMIYTHMKLWSGENSSNGELQQLELGRSLRSIPLSCRSLLRRTNVESVVSNSFLASSDKYSTN